MIVLTHLILKDMVKVRGHIGEVALVLEDEDDVIASKARYLFSQLANKVGSERTPRYKFSNPQL